MYNYTGNKFPEKYLQEIRDHGLIPPVTAHGCHSMLVFIAQGNYGTREMRIDLLKRGQADWTGHRVRVARSLHPGDGGIVRFVTAASKDHWRFSNENPLSHLHAMVQTHAGRQRYMQVSRLVKAD